MLEDALWLNQVLLVRVRETHDAPIVVILPEHHDHDFDDDGHHDVDNDDDHDVDDGDDVDGDEDHHNPHQYPHPQLACLMCFSCIFYSDSSSKLHKRAT